jgi:hypothetical protein
MKLALALGTILAAGLAMAEPPAITDAEAELFERLSGMATSAEMARDNAGKALAKKCQDAGATLQRDPSNGGRLMCAAPPGAPPVVTSAAPSAVGPTISKR